MPPSPPPRVDGDEREDLAAAVAAAIAAIYQALRTENTRRDQETNARNLALAKALGLATDEPPDPAQLARELEAAKAQTTAEVERAQKRERELTVELESLKQARRHGADAEMLVDSRSFMRTLGQLDPTLEDFADDLGEAIKKAVDANPGFKLTTNTPRATGNGDSGGRGPSNASAGNGESNGGDGGSGHGQGSGSKPTKSKQGTTAPPARSGTAGSGVSCTGAAEATSGPRGDAGRCTSRRARATPGCAGDTGWREWQRLGRW